MALIEIDVRQVEALADKVRHLTAQELQQASVNAVNIVAERSEQRLREFVLRDLNMQEAYYRRKTGRNDARANGAGVTVGSVYALANTRDDRRSRLARYDPKALTQAAQSTRAKGNSNVGIPKGRKAAGVSVEVMRGRREVMPGAFLMPLKSGADSGGWGGPLGLFTRSKDGKVSKHRLGPAAYQVFRHARDIHIDEISAELETELLREVDAIINKALE